VEHQVLSIYAAGKGYFNDIDVDKVREAEKKLIEFATKTKQALLDKIKAGEWSEEIEQGVKEICEQFKKQ